MRLSPVLASVAGKFGDDFKIAKVNLDAPENQELAAKYNIQFIPALLFFRNGQVVRQEGPPRSEAALADTITSVLQG